MVKVSSTSYIIVDTGVVSVLGGRGLFLIRDEYLWMSGGKRHIAGMLSYCSYASCRFCGLDRLPAN